MAHESEARRWGRYVHRGDIRPWDYHGRVCGPSLHLRRDVGEAVETVRGTVVVAALAAAAVLEQLAGLELRITLLTLPP